MQAGFDSLTAWVFSFTIILSISYILSLFGRYFWLFDLFTHFLVQYAIGAAILTIALLYLNKMPMAGVPFTILMLCLCQIAAALPVTKIPGDIEGKHFIIAQYNKFYHNRNYDAIRTWLRANKDTFDVISMQEMLQVDIDEMQSLKDIYPYRFPEQKTAGTDVYLMSKHPIIESSFIKNETDIPAALGLRIKVDTPAGPIIVYAIHAKTPMTRATQLKRNTELSGMARTIAQDQSANIVFTGDWNITPFSPHFKDTLRLSGLKNEYSSYIPALSWPSTLLVPFFKIPIDHVLSNDNMHLTEKMVGPSFGSDHHSLVATFIVTGETL